MSDFGKSLQLLRTKRGISQKELASLSGVSASYLSRIETSQRNVPHPEVLKKLAKPLGLSELEMLAAAGYVTEDTGGYPGKLVPPHWREIITDPSIDKALELMGGLTEEEKKNLAVYLMAIKLHRETK